ncbi:MAG: hypothetical protein LW808_002315 [Verrucomicrobiota bacterium]|nr:MAG: hypothetical protein LW808_002315 [Verrucomicrobiota bacterium]
MKTQFAAIFSLMGTLLTSPCAFGKELKDYNLDELKQAVQDIVDRLYKGYKEPFGTIMYSLGRKSPKGPWDGAGQSEKKPSDDTDSEPKKDGVKTSQNYVDLLKKGSFSVKPSYVKLNAKQAPIVRGFKIHYQLASADELGSVKFGQAQPDALMYGTKIEGYFSNINGDDKDKTWSGRKFKNVNGCSGRVMVYFKKPLDEKHVEGGEFFFEGTPSIWVWIDSKGKDYVMNLDGLEMDQRQLIDGFKIEKKLVDTMGMPESAVNRRTAAYQDAIKGAKYEETDKFKRYRFNKWERLTIYKTVSDDKVCADFLTKGDSNILVTIYSNGTESIKEVPDDDISEIEKDEPKNEGDDDKPWSSSTSSSDDSSDSSN